MNDYDYSLKFIMVGNPGVGKSTLIEKYINNRFVSPNDITIGVEYNYKIVNIDNKKIKIELWDTAGQEEFDAITKAYYRGAQACVVAFSTIDRASFDAVQKWKKKVEDECGAIPMVLVQNKIDLVHEAEVAP